MNRRHRLSRSGEFQRVRRQGRSWSHPLLVLLAVRNDLNRTRFGFVVGKRIGKAVVRNRVRRLLREAARMRLSCIAVGWDIVLIARTPIVEENFWHIGEALDSLLQRAELSAGQSSASGTADRTVSGVGTPSRAVGGVGTPSRAVGGAGTPSRISATAPRVSAAAPRVFGGVGGVGGTDT